MPIATEKQLLPTISVKSLFAALSSSTLVADESSETSHLSVETVLKENSKNISNTATFTWPSGATYKGEFFNGQRNGYGVQTWKDGSLYKGEFLNDMRHGLGYHQWSSGEVLYNIYFIFA